MVIRLCIIRNFTNRFVKIAYMNIFRYLCISSYLSAFCPSTEKHLWKITKQIILVIKKEVIVFVKTNYFKCLHFSISQIKFYQIFQTYSGTITNRRRKSKTMVIYQIFLIFKMIIESKVVRSAYQCQKTSHLHL